MDILKYTTNLVTSLIRTIPDPDEYWNLSAYINLELFMVIQLWTICLIVTKQDWRKWCGPPRFCAVTKSGKQSFFSKKDRIWRVNIFAVSAPLSWTGEKWDWLICLDLAFRTHYHYWGRFRSLHKLHHVALCPCAKRINCVSNDEWGNASAMNSSNERLVNRNPVCYTRQFTTYKSGSKTIFKIDKIRSKWP